MNILSKVAIEKLLFFITNLFKNVGNFSYLSHSVGRRIQNKRSQYELIFRESRLLFKAL